MSGVATAIAVAAGATVYSGSKAASAAKSAASTQAGSAALGVEEQRRQFDITQESLAPFREAGVSALDQQRILLGLGSTSHEDLRRKSLESKLSALPARAAPGFRRQLNEERAELQRQLQEIPEVATGSQLTPLQEQEQAFAQLSESPGQRFLRDRQQKALVRSASAIGGLGGGNVRTALQEQAMGFAQQDIQNQFGRLGQLAGQGQAAGTSIGQFGAQAAGNIASLQQVGGQARASGILGAQQARSQTIGDIAGLGGMALGAFTKPNNQFSQSFFGG